MLDSRSRWAAVLEAVRDQMPHESVVYVADQRFAPYTSAQWTRCGSGPARLQENWSVVLSREFCL